MKRYNPAEIEPKWQKIWDETKVYEADLNSSKPKYMAMGMFNYPSGAGIHIGHAMNYTISDVKVRFKRQQGYESFHPVGWDSFGLPAENFAIKSGVSPQQSMAKIIPSYHAQYKAMGWSNDWSKEIATHTPDYYKWTQWIFSQMFKNGLAYQDSRMQWWCEKDKTVLSNEQVIDGKCWRHDGPDDPLVEQKEVKQWFFKITDYADELLEATDALDWTESVKLAQKNWIGRSIGAEVDFSVDHVSQYVSLHGFGADSTSNFHPWLKKELEKQGASVIVPNLPHSDKPDAQEQAAFVMSNTEFDENTVLLGHSYGSVTALRVVEMLTKPIKRLVLIAGFAEPGFEDHERVFESTTDWNFDFEKIKQNVNEIVILRASNDTAVPLERANYLRDKLGGKIIDFTATSDHVTGAIEPEVLHAVQKTVRVFTTRPDTLFGATFIVLAPEHELVKELVTSEQKAAVDEYIRTAKKKTEVERQAAKEKTGIFLGSYAINPINGEKLPIWIADYVLTGYGTGAIMAVPAHDERDNEFANKYELPIIQVVTSQEGEELYSGDGSLVNSGVYDGIQSFEAREQIITHLAREGKGQEKVNYRMRDWSVSRQRYWGAPIPIIHCQKDGAVLVPDEQLPVVLPELKDFQPSGDGRSALARAEDWLHTICPTCGGEAERETDTLDTYICSSWYMFRYLDSKNENAIFDSEIINKWTPIDFYNGADHATAHMLYARFMTRFFTRIGLMNNPEPFKQFLFNGKVTASDGTMFSKSKGNGVDPLEIINQGYGADALRTYLMFAAPLELWAKWDPQGVPGTHRFLNRLWTLVQEYTQAQPSELDDATQKTIRSGTHRMIKKMTVDIDEDRYNTAIAAAMTRVNELYKLKVDHLAVHAVWQEALEALVACVAPFAPHIADELWAVLGNEATVQTDSWPIWDEEQLSEDTITIVLQINGKVRAEVLVSAGIEKDELEKLALTNAKIVELLDGKKPARVVIVPGRLVNVVV